MTPAVVHYGRVDQVSGQRQQVMDMAYEIHPERFRGGRPAVATPPQEVWINPPLQGLASGLAVAQTQPGSCQTPGNELVGSGLEEKSSLILVNELSQKP